MLQVDSSGRVKLQLAVSALDRSADDVEELRAELDRMEYGGEDADDAQMYAAAFSHPIKYLCISSTRTIYAHPPCNDTRCK